VVFWPLRNGTERDEYVKMLGRYKVLALVVQYPRLPSHLFGFALNRNGARSLRVRNKNVDAARVTERDRGDVAAP
jgi:hypothetical protein